MSDAEMLAALEQLQAIEARAAAANPLTAAKLAKEAAGVSLAVVSELVRREVSRNG